MTRISQLRPLAFLTVAIALSSATLRAQGTAAIDPRWQPWIGCWEAADAAGLRVVGSPKAPMVCAVPSGASTGVDVVTVANGQVLDRSSLDASGQRLARTRDGCTGWESGEWAKSGSRVYVRSEYTCAGGATRASNGLLSISPRGEWLDVQNIATGSVAAIRAVRMREASNLSALPADIAAVLQARPRMMGVARGTASTVLGMNDLVDVAQHVDSAVMQAWVVEREQGFVLDAKRLVHLADSGVPANVIDVMVALSYPKVFAVNPSTGAAEMLPEDKSGAESRGRSLAVLGYDPIGFPVFGYGGLYGDCDMPYYGSYYSYYNPRSAYYSGCSSRYGAYGLGGYGYGSYGYGGYGYGGWYPGYRPVVIVRGGGDNVPAGERPRVVKGRGYSQGSSGGSGSSGSSGGSSSSSGGSSSSGSASGSSGSGGAAAAPRTAQPRKPPA